MTSAHICERLRSRRKDSWNTPLPPIRRHSSLYSDGDVFMRRPTNAFSSIISDVLQIDRSVADHDSLLERLNVYVGMHSHLNTASRDELLLILGRCSSHNRYFRL